MIEVVIGRNERDQMRWISKNARPLSASPASTSDWADSTSRERVPAPARGAIEDANEAVGENGGDDAQDAQMSTRDELTVMARQALLDEADRQAEPVTQIGAGGVRAVNGTVQGLTALSPSADITDIIRKMTLEEMAVCLEYVGACMRSMNSAEDAKYWVRRWYPNLDGEDDLKDAVRHCIWSAYMTKRGSFKFAKAYGDAYEQNPNSRHGKMDLHNNAKGRQVGMDGQNETARWIAVKCRFLGENYPRELIISLSDPRIN